MKLIFSRKRIWIMLVLFLLTITSVAVGTTLAKYTTVEDGGSFDLHIRPAEHAYAVYSETDNSLDFYYGSYPAEGTTLANGNTVTKVYHDHITAASYTREWGEIAASVVSVRFDESMAPYSPVSMRSWFSGFTNATSFDLTYLNTSSTTDMAYTFYNCTKVTTLNVSNFDTGAVTNMAHMFRACSMLTSLEGIANFDTADVTSMERMFAGCTEINQLDVSSFDTGKVTTMENMFAACGKLIELNISNFDTSEVTVIRRMFSGDTALKSLVLSDKFNTAKVKDMTQMFNGCYSLTNLDLSCFNTSNVTTMYYMFKGCSSLESLNLSSFNTASVKDMIEMFGACTFLKTIFVSEEFIVDNVTESSNMFLDCSNLIGGNNTTLKTMGYVIDKTYARIDKVGQPGYFTCKHTFVDGVCSVCGALVYTLTFDANGGTNAPASVTGNTATLQIPVDTIPTREGYVFLGNDTNEEVDAADVTYKYVGDGFSQDFAFSGTDATATLYAIWSNTTLTFCFVDQNLFGPTAQEFKFTVGMTWGAWVKSDYNKLNGRAFLTYGDIADGELSDVFYYLAYEDFDRGEYMVLSNEDTHIVKSDVIDSDSNYKLNVYGDTAV